MLLPGRPEIPFSPGDWILDRKNPGNPGQFTGNSRDAGSYILVELSFPGGRRRWRPLGILELMPCDGSISDRLQTGRFGRIRDLQRLITYEKLKGTLYEIIYSMEAAQIDFYPYQFKPVLKFINSPTERLIIADEVGLGKTIESALIWLELQARRQAKRLLVICPKILGPKWREELRSKFLLDAREVDFAGLRQEISELKENGPHHQFVVIGTYTGLRPPKSELQLLKVSPDSDPGGSAKTAFLRELRNWNLDYAAFDMVVFDEAHHMRNPATTTFHLGESLAMNAGSVLCVSATPVNNSNTDLHTLLRLIDESFFATQGFFEELLDANRPAVQAGNALAYIPVNRVLLESSLENMGVSRFIRESPLFNLFRDLVEHLDIENKAEVTKCQDLAEKLNLLGSYVNRTRRVQVKENRPIRDPKVLEVTFSAEERGLYKIILKLVRRKCGLDNRPFHVFQVLGLQLRAASCLPVLADEIRNGRFGDSHDLLDEAIGEDVIDDMADERLHEDLESPGQNSLADYDFEANDSKYRALSRMLLELVAEEKVVIFAYYRPTLAYLGRRLIADGVAVAVIHGGVPIEQRIGEIEHFKDSRGARVLLSSEVGAEGIDLQFCRVMVNYDLPWNPMRVEQRIGRIDRIGQQARRLSVVNFKVKGTVEERLYESLHSKLERFTNSLGDLEAIIGNEVQELTVKLLTQELTPEQERQLIDQSERVIEERLLQIQALEESGDALLALSDYVQRKIEEDRKRGRYIQPEELEAYLTDFFEREFQGCEINFNTPSEGCFQIRLTPEAQASLSAFIGDDRSLSARPWRQKQFSITFRREVIQALHPAARRLIHFVNHLSPLVRWITKVNRDRAHGFFNVSAIRSSHAKLPPGDYCYHLERWKLKGLTTRETLAYGVISIRDCKVCTPDESETIINHLLHEAEDWDYVDCDNAALLKAHKAIEDDMASRFTKVLEEFEAENGTAYQIRRQRVESFFDRRIAQDEQRLRTLREAGRDSRVIPAAEGRLRMARENKAQRLHELELKAEIDSEFEPVGAGLFRIHG